VLVQSIISETVLTVFGTKEGETVETVFRFSVTLITRLKPGVNERDF
jgi:hypothetical protein